MGHFCSMAAATSTRNESNNLLQEERKVVSSLADLQDLHEKVCQVSKGSFYYDPTAYRQIQLQHLRDLLPDRILEPLHNAYLTIPGTPQKSNTPEQAFAKLGETAKTGFAQIEEFKKLWQSNSIEHARKRVKVEYIGQGDDVFREDYRDTLAVFQKREERIKKKEEARERDFDPDEATEDQDPPKVILDRWLARKEKGEVQVQVENVKDDGAAFDVTTGGLALSVTSTLRNSTRHWTVHSRKDTETTGRKTGVIGCLNARKNRKSLGYLLDMLESYRNIFGGRDGRCEACDRLLGHGSGDMPFVRRRKMVVGEDGKVTYPWGTYHEERSCWAFKEDKKPGE